MEEAVTDVISKLGQTERSIDEIDDRLDAKFSSLINGNETKVNAIAIQELNEIKKEFIAVQKDALELGRLQKEIIVTFQQGISETLSTLQSLANTGSNAKGEDAGKSPDEFIGQLVTQSQIAERLSEKLKNASSS